LTIENSSNDLDGFTIQSSIRFVKERNQGCIYIVQEMLIKN